MIPSDTHDVLRQVNDSLRLSLLRLRPERNLCSSIRPQDLAGIVAQLLRAAACLRLPPANALARAAFEQEALAYRANLEQLKHVLPDLCLRLLAEKSRLETARTHLAAAAAWTQARRKTL